MKASLLTAEKFQAWRLKHGMSGPACAARLGVSASSIRLYESGQRDGRNVAIPLTVCLAMSAIDNNLEPYNGEENDSHQGDSSSS